MRKSVPRILKLPEDTKRRGDTEAGVGGGSTKEEDSSPGTGGTTPLETGRYLAVGQGRQGGGVVLIMVEEGRNVEGITHRC